MLKTRKEGFAPGGDRRFARELFIGLAQFLCALIYLLIQVRQFPFGVPGQSPFPGKRRRYLQYLHHVERLLEDEQPVVLASGCGPFGPSYNQNMRCK